MFHGYQADIAKVQASADGGTNTETVYWRTPAFLSEDSRECFPQIYSEFQVQFSTLLFSTLREGRSERTCPLFVATNSQLDCSFQMLLQAAHTSNNSRACSHRQNGHARHRICELNASSREASMKKIVRSHCSERQEDVCEIIREMAAR